MAWETTDETAAESEMRELLYALVRMLKPALVVETGCYYGATTRALGEACARNQLGRVVTCDVIEDYVQRAAQACHGLPVEVRLCPSWELPELEEADFIFSDSDYRYRLGEIGRAKPGAIILVHDTRLSYDSEIPPLETMVRALGGLTFPTYRGFGVLVKQ